MKNKNGKIEALLEKNGIEIKDKNGKEKNGIPLVECKGQDAKLISEFARVYTEVKELEQVRSGLEEQIIAKADKKLEEACESAFVKSIRFSDTDNTLLVTRTDRFSVSGEKEEIQEAAGKYFDELFEEQYTISLSPEAIKDDAVLQEIIDKYGKYFDISKKIVARKGFDEKIFNLPKTLWSKIQSVVKRAKPSIKVE